MSTERLRYVQRRRNRNGKDRYYWRRPGFRMVRLPDNRAKRVALADKLNDEADKANTPSAVSDEDTLAWLIAEYKKSHRYVDRAAETQRIYGRWLDRIGKMWGALPPKFLTRRVVYRWIERIESRASQQQAAAVLYNVLEMARRYGLVQINNAARLGLASPKPRDVRWSWEEIDRFVAACDDPAVLLAFYLLLYTAQRPVDVLKMKWSAYDGETIWLRQQKTGVLVEVPCHRDLRAILEAEKTERRGLTIVGDRNGQPLSRDSLTAKFKALRRKCDLEHVQARDLRRTAIVMMGEAGATEVQIAAVSGHKIESTRQILETYLPRTGKMARGAIEKWERHEHK